MKSAPASEVPNVLVVSSRQSFRAQLEKWLPSPAINVVESVGVSNLQQRIALSIPALVIVDQQFEDYPQLLSSLASLAPGVPYVAVSLEQPNPDIAASSEDGKAGEGHEAPTRDSVISAIRNVAPTVAARLD